MNYSKEFKEEALKLSDEIGIKKAAEQLGLKYYTLAEWRKNRKVRLSEPINQLTDVEAKARIRELEKRNAELEKANDILKDALGFFAKDRKK
jgi:transposase